MFQTSIPVTAEYFDNRRAELARLMEAVARLQKGAPAWVAIIGARKIGKTSLVLESVRRSAGRELAAVTLDVQESAPVSMEIFRLYALRAVDAVSGPELGESLERVSRAPAEYRGRLQEWVRFTALPAEARSELLEIPEGRASPDRIRRWLQLPEILAEVSGRRLIVAIDEFQDLEALASNRASFDPFALMRSVWQQHKRVAYFISGSARSMLLALATAEHSPFFQHFAVMDLGPFNDAEAVSLLENHGPPGCPIRRELAAHIVDAIGGHPFYLQILGETLVRAGRAPDMEDLKAALQEVLFSRTGRLALYFENEFNLLVGRSTGLAATLEALAERPARLTDIAAHLKTSTGSAVRYVERLADAVRKRDDGLYELSDRTFGLWLRWRRPGGTVLPMTLVGDDAERTVAAALSEMGFDLVYQSRASRGAFDLMAARGAAQLGIQVKRSDLPLRFTRHAWSRMEAEAARLGWAWILAAVDKQGKLTLLDPARARKREEARLDEAAAVHNLLLWLDRRKTPEGRRTAPARA